MYTQELSISLEVLQRMRKKMNDINQFYKELDVSFKLINEPGNNRLLIEASQSSNFNQALKEINSIIHKLNSDYNNQLNRRKIQKEKRERTRMKKAAKEIEKNINRSNNEETINKGTEVSEEGLKRNYFYGLQDNVPCVPTYNGIPKNQN